MIRSFLLPLATRRGRRGPTEARTSIRESLRIFKELETHFEQHHDNNNNSSNNESSSSPASSSSLQFERNVTQHAENIQFDGVRSCGLTSRCFASLFFSRAQLRRNHNLLYTNGSDITQLWDNWNLVLYGMWRRRSSHMSWRDDIQEAKISSSTTMDKVTQLLRYRASTKSDNLLASLLRSDNLDELPRVVFCNLTWVLLHDHPINSSINRSVLVNDENYDDMKSEDEEVSRNIKDHQFTIIKHSDDSFQLVQGYMDENTATNIDNECDNETRTTASSSTSIGYCLSSWQNHPQPGGLRFASRHGFTAAELVVFCGGIRGFATSSCFDGSSYQQLFGMWHSSSNNVAIWPSFSFRELIDDSIEGYGDRFVGHSLEAALRSSSSTSGGISKQATNHPLNE